MLNRSATRRGRLYVTGATQIETSSAGLNHSVFKVPLYSQAEPARPREPGPRYTLINAAAVPQAAMSALQEMETEYGPAYEGSGTVFIANDAALRT